MSQLCGKPNRNSHKSLHATIIIIYHYLLKTNYNLASVNKKTQTKKCRFVCSKHTHRKRIALLENESDYNDKQTKNKTTQKKKYE